ncbi:YitT family protein [Peptoniphilus sp. GNH]|nr:hypothetical protein HMPREF3189_00600 [Clostridiales bacterium KA00134]UHR02288.1 YitT family protein [Peptoniphilus sp. GNH]
MTDKDINAEGKFLKRIDRQVARRTVFRKLMALIVGDFVSSVALVFFLRAHHMLSGGVNGISIILDYVTGIPVGLLILLLNLPLIVLGLIYLKKEFMFYTIISIFLYSFYVSMFTKLMPKGFMVTNDILLAAIFGGVLSGLGSGINFRNGTSTGGFDIVAAIMKKKLNISIGNVLLTCNFFIVSTSAFIFSLDKALYTILSMAVTYSLVDRIQLGVGKQKQIFIISNQYEKIAEIIQFKLDRGITYIDGEGAWSGDAVKIIYCVASSYQVVKIRQYVKELDPRAFMAVSDTAEIQGKGFKNTEI